MLIQHIEIIAHILQEPDVLPLVIDANKQEQDVDTKKAAKKKAQLRKERLDNINQRLQVGSNRQSFDARWQPLDNHGNENSLNYIYFPQLLRRFFRGRMYRCEIFFYDNRQRRFRQREMFSILGKRNGAYVLGMSIAVKRIFQRKAGRVG